jgi:hypothetical protein
MNRRQKLLGIVKITEHESKFYFIDLDIGKSITASNKFYSEHVRKYYSEFFSNMVSFNDIFEDRIVKDKDKADIDLSPVNVTKDTFTELVK